MSTISNHVAVKELLRNKGVDSDATYVRIYSYKGVSNELMFAIFTDKTYDDMWISPYVIDPQLLMEDGELTDAGKEFLAKE